MDAKSYEQIKALVQQLDDDWGCGPYEEALPNEAQLREINALTGRSWTAEEVRDICFEYSSHNSTEETAYCLLFGEYPPADNADLVFYRPKPGAVLKPEAVYEKYRLGGQMKALAPLPRARITEGLRAFPGFREHPWAASGYQPDCSHSLRFDALDQPDDWSDVHFWVFWYGGRGNPDPDHLLCLSCHNLPQMQIQALTDLLAGFDVPLQYREEDHDN